MEAYKSKRRFESIEAGDSVLVDDGERTASVKTASMRAIQTSQKQRFVGIALSEIRHNGPWLIFDVGIGGIEDPMSLSPMRVYFTKKNSPMKNFPSTIKRGAFMSMIGRFCVAGSDCAVGFLAQHIVTLMDDSGPLPEVRYAGSFKPQAAPALSLRDEDDDGLSLTPLGLMRPRPGESEHSVERGGPQEKLGADVEKRITKALSAAKQVNEAYGDEDDADERDSGRRSRNWDDDAEGSEGAENGVWEFESDEGEEREAPSGGETGFWKNMPAAAMARAEPFAFSGARVGFVRVAFERPPAAVGVRLERPRTAK